MKSGDCSIEIRIDIVGALLDPHQSKGTVAMCSLFRHPPPSLEQVSLAFETTL
jgi:hypothetical protein